MGKGGVCLIWHKQYNTYVVPLSIDDDRIVGIQLQTAPGQFMFIFQLYLPCSNNPVNKYREYIDKLDDVWFSYSGSGTVLFMGDVNAQCCSSSIRTRDQLLCKRIPLLLLLIL